MNKVLNYRVWHALTNKLRHQVQMVVVANYDGCLFVRLSKYLSLFNHGVGKGLVHWNVTRFPGVVHGGIHVGVVGRVPHVMLQEPQERVA